MIRITALAMLLGPVGFASATTPSTCPLDCDGNGRLAPIERRRLPAALYSQVDGCSAVDVNADALVSAADLVALQSALRRMPDACLLAESEWVALAPLAGGARQEVGVAEVDGFVYVIGGFDAPFAGQSNRVERYDIGADTWSEVASLPLTAHHIGAGVVGGDLYAIGGLTSLRFDPRGEVYRYDATADRWEERAPLPTPRGALAVATVGRRLHAIGGFGAGVAVTDHAAYDAVTDVWETRAPMPEARDHLAAVTIDGAIYVIGGRTPNTARLDRYDVANDSWQSRAPMPTARSGHAAAAIDGKLVVIGGEVNNANPPNRVFEEVEIYDPETDRWVSLPPMAVPRHGMGAIAVDGALYVPGGAFRAGFGASDRNDLLLLRW